MNYYTVLGLEKEPFSTSPEPDFFYQSHGHRSTLTNMLIEIRLRRGLSVVLGDIGTGKTTLSRKLFQQISSREYIDFYMILDPTYETEELFLISLIKTFGIEIDIFNSNILEFKTAIKDFLFQKGVNENKIIVLLVDEAQKLNPLSLEVLRMLLNYETNEFKLLQLMLLGQMELLPSLNATKNLMDRVSSIQVLTPFNMRETKEMIEFRVRQAGYTRNDSLFSEEAIREIYKHTQGYPRRIGMLCHKALKLLVMREKASVDMEIIKELIDHEVKLRWQRSDILQKSSC
jgi:general secretion pathway protein A